MRFSLGWMARALAPLAICGCGLVEADEADPDATEPHENDAWLAFGMGGDDASGAFGLFATQLGRDQPIEVRPSADRLIDLEWSPTAPMLAVSVTKSNGESELELVSFGADGVVERTPIERASEQLYPLKWSPDGRWLTFDVSDELCVFSLGTSSPLTSWLDATSSPVWNPTSSAFAYEVLDFSNADADQLIIARADEGFLPRKVPLPTGAHHPRLLDQPDDGGWSPNGRWLVFAANEKSSDGSLNVNLFVTDERAEHTQRLSKHDNAIGGYFGWSPDESIIIYTDSSPDVTDPPFSTLYAIAFEGGVLAGAPIAVARGNAHFTWLDGRRAFVLERQPSQTTSARIVDFSQFPKLEPEPLFSVEAQCFVPSPTVDPLRLAMSCKAHENSDYLLWVWQSSLTLPVAVAETATRDGHSLRWSPEADRFAVVSIDPTNQRGPLHDFDVTQMKASLVDENARRLTANAITQIWTHDGVAYVYLRDDGALMARIPSESRSAELVHIAGMVARSVRWQAAGFASW